MSVHYFTKSRGLHDFLCFYFVRSFAAFANAANKICYISSSEVIGIF